MSTFRPILASPVEDLEKLRFPVLVSPKLDGVRCLIVNGQLVTRNLKGIPNAFVREALSGLPDFDGELVVGDPTTPNVFNVTQSAVMSRDGTPDFTYYVFDHHSHPFGFADRLHAVRTALSLFHNPHVVKLPHNEVHSIAELAQYEDAFVKAGYEGAMIRDPGGRYKHGRSTAKEGILLKLKRFSDAEAIVVGTVERLHNANVAMTNALGRTERSSHKANMVPTGALGALVCQWAEPADRFQQLLTFEIGTGFSEAQRQEFWTNREDLRARLAKFKFQGITPDGKPRFPVFLGWRAREDLS